MDPKAKGEFLKKLATNGFSIEERDNQLTLRPRGMEGTAQITIEEVEPNEWEVIGAAGTYIRFAKGEGRKKFEMYIKKWATEAVLQAEG